MFGSRSPLPSVVLFFWREMAFVFRKGRELGREKRQSSRFSLGGLTLFLWLWGLPVQALVEMRVAVEQGAKQVRIGSSTSAEVKDGTGRTVGQLEQLGGLVASVQGNGVQLAQWQGQQFWIEPRGAGLVWIGDRWYRGKIRLIAHGQGITAINHVDLEEYLYSVVASEMYPHWPLEALKTQAVAARSYALYKRSENRHPLFDVDNSQASQVYQGVGNETASTQQAVQATRGQVLTYNGAVILAAFHSASGGHTENVEDIWSSRLPYLRGVPDFDQGAPVYQWSQSFSLDELTRRLGGVGRIRSLMPEQVTPRGRIKTIRVVGDRGSKVMKGGDLRQALNLKSTLFNITPTGQGFILQGRGFGHGVGMSQWGAQALAQRGYSYSQILAYYYQNTTLAQMRDR